MTRTDRRRLAVAVLTATAGALLLAGCGPHLPSAAAGGAGAPAGGASAAPAAGGAPIDVCALVTEDEATTALGQPAGAGVPGGTADVPQCQYANGALMVIADHTGKAGYESNHSAMASAAQDVTGIGDGAFEVSGGPTALVYFYKGQTLVEIMLQGRLSAPADAAIALARTAAPRV